MAAHPRLGRRLLALKVSAAAALLAGCVAPSPGYYGVPAAAPYAPPRAGRSDADPVDAPGAGRGGVRGTGLTDSDPSDGPGQGRGGYRRGTGLTDSDPSDGPGRGRGGHRAAPRTGRSDADPHDAPGRGRRW